MIMLQLCISGQKATEMMSSCPWSSYHGVHDVVYLITGDADLDLLAKVSSPL